MAQPTKKPYWEVCDYARRLDVPTANGALCSPFKRQTIKWLFGVDAWLGAAEGKIDGRVLNGLREIMSCLPLYIVDGYVLNDGRQFACFSESQMLAEVGWGADAAPRLRRGLRVLALAPAATDGQKIAHDCARLREGYGLEPLIALIEKGVRHSHGSVWELVGIEPLPEPPAINLTGDISNLGGDISNLGGDISNLGGDISSGRGHANHPQKQGRNAVSSGASSVHGDDGFSVSPADMPSFAENAAPPQDAVSGAIAANRDIAPSYISTYQCSVLSCQDVPERDAANHHNDGHKKVNDADRCFTELVGLFHNGVGKPEFTAKTRAAFSALLGKGAAPGAVLARAKEVRDRGALPVYPLLLLERQAAFADLFSADPRAVMDWAADYGITAELPAAREIHAARHPGPFGAADLSGEADARIREIYAANEADLQRAYAVAHAGRAA